MKMDEYLVEDEWKNITEYIFVCLSNVCDSVDWQISISLYDDTISKGMLSGGNVGVITAQGIILNQNFRYDLRLVSTIIPEPQEYHITNNAFMILARKKKAR